MDRKGHFKPVVEPKLESHSFLRKYQSLKLAAKLRQELVELIQVQAVLVQMLAEKYSGKDRKNQLAAAEARVLNSN